MNTILHGIIKFRKSILLLFGIAIVLSLLLLSGTDVNYNMVDYLPKEANSTQAIDILGREFNQGMPNLSVMVKNVSIQEALDMKDKLLAIDGVEKVMWLDDVVSEEKLISVPSSYLDENISHSYYKNQTALYSLIITSGMEGGAVEGVYEVIGKDNALTGEALGTASSQMGAVSEVANAMMILIPIIIIMLIIATDSWIEPIFFMGTIGIAILINMGSNVFLGEISFVTKTVSPILQLAVSMDYAIFLLHSFTEKRKTYEPEEAMFYAMKESMPTVAASALTTIIGFSALIFMRFGIGADLGINLFKGIALSFISVMVFLPVVTLIFYKWIDKTMHKNFMPHPGGLSRMLLKIKIPMLVLSLLLVVPAFLGQSSVKFKYGMEMETEEVRPERDKEMIEEIFGNSQILLLMVPRQGRTREVELIEELQELPFMKEVVAYGSMVGTKVPLDYVPDEAVDNFYTETYARLMLYTNLENEGDRSFKAVDLIKKITADYYDKYYLAGQSPTLNDMKNVVAVDLSRINLIAVIGIFIVLLLTFRSLTIPLILIFTIESAIWINLSVPYFTGITISFIGYLVLSTVQLGATVDYAILMTHRYLDARKRMDKHDAMWHALKNNVAAVLISATILATAGFTLAATTGQALIKELGLLLGRGTVLSFVMVVAVLPALLVLFDKVIQYTTLGHGFHHLHTDEEKLEKEETFHG